MSRAQPSHTPKYVPAFACVRAHARRERATLHTPSDAENSHTHRYVTRSRRSFRIAELSQAYVDEDNGFVLTPPPRWARGSKGGAAVIFSDPEYKYNNLGVTVTPVKVATLQEFGAIEDAADRLLAFEKKKVGSHVPLPSLRLASRPFAFALRKQSF